MENSKNLKEAYNEVILLGFIKLSNVCFGYKDNQDIIKNISLELFKEDFTAFTGPNGGGKTTLGKLMAGIFKPSRGDILIDGTNSKDLKLGAVGKKIGYLFQNPERQIFAPTVEEDITFSLIFKGVEKQQVTMKAQEMMEIFQLSHLRNQFPFTLSQGEKQRLALAGILINEPSFLILDEPTTGLDIERKGQLSSILKELSKRGVGMAVISHDDEFIQNLSTRIIDIVGGNVIADKRK
ncbi:energy-coupling factor ABC transporter ATP-binding protein [Alkaliphilus peptidifermentans]|uniref:Energy-coupling factor transport system ATP-binding protein n=1 Tax=Alkaliphilus peptidifermentans DSM 18978 TaxID=1120976 RepID=A0A1G5GKN4_9FIRM|nr:ABC transporter ATP-binding protein [Alkaliphilus peptidifermentans]SCY52083.1 energy-coupling factor transport system ATP-binding protein [Alkaliphilus peptidifermentans DSM 18978]